jgi:[acyl-carrier-protein] S-malonyltransferase
MTKTAWVFPGQGSQAVQMGMDLLEIPEAKAKFDLASELLGWSVIDRIQGDVTELSKTLYTQPCLYVVEATLADQLKKRSKTPDFVAGHSLGEYSALYAAEVFSFEAGLKIIQTRSQLMDSSSSGSMAALLGFDRSALESAIASTEGVVLANDNNDGQVVISGTPDAVDFILTNVKAKRGVKLNVSGAFHSPLMSEAAETFSAVLKDMPFNDAKIPVLSNTDPTLATQATELKDRLSRQMTGSVRWREISLGLLDLGVTQITEVGPGKVLVGIMKRTCAAVEFSTIGTVAELAALD